ncbi:amino acid ABC transporter permease [Paracoccaceae bacterium]
MSTLWLVGLGLYFYTYSGADWSLFGEQFLNHEKMKGRYSFFIEPLILVAQISLWSCIFSTLIGLFLAGLRSTNNVFVVAFVTSYVVFFRAIPAIVLVVLVYFALPFLGIALVSTTSVIVALSMMFGAYTTEIFRSGIDSVHRIQIEAAKSVGMTALQSMRWVVLPQALRVVIPPLTGVLIDVLKTTSIAYVVGVPELIARARQMEGVIGSVTPLIFVSFLYFIIVLPLVIVSSRLEKRSRRWSESRAV